MAIISGYHDLVRVVEALGLQNHRVQRIVIDMGVNDVMRVYAVMVGDEEQADALADLLAQSQPVVQEVASVEVETSGGLTVTPIPVAQRNDP